MLPLWLQHWGLHRDPFSKEIEAQEFWLPASKHEMINRMVSAIQERASALLVGEPGVGKTCILRALRERLPEAGFRLTYCHNVTLGRRDFYRQLCGAMGLSAKATAAGVFQQVSAHVQDLGNESVHPVLLIDEAHLLHQEVLDHLHILLNYAWDAKALLSVVLVGLPDLWDNLEFRRNRSLYSRLSTRLCIGPAQLEDTAEYVQHRLTNAGVTRALFEGGAIGLLHEASGGTLRGIDRLARAALQKAAPMKVKIITSDAMQDVINTESRRS